MSLLIGCDVTVESVKQTLENRTTYNERLKQEMPEIYEAFYGDLVEKVYREGEIDRRHKQLIAIGISVAVRCLTCIATHVERALKAGATRGEIFEATAIGIEMGGGPSLPAARMVVKALEELT